MKKEITYVERVKVFEKVVDFCHTHLFDPSQGRVLSYLRDERSLSLQTIKKFKLGLFPRFPDVIANMVGGFDAWKCGLIGFNPEGEMLSRFLTHDVIIPIFDQRNNPIAIMGRTLLSNDEQKERGLPKYTNSPFKKSRSLFGLNLAKDEIRKKDEVVLVEGNFDVITSFQNGMKNVVGVSSTSLSKQQVSLVSRYTQNLSILLDNDTAGRDGTSRALKLYKDYKDVALKVLKLPSGMKDLDDYFTSKAFLETRKK